MSKSANFISEAFFCFMQVVNVLYCHGHRQTCRRLTQETVSPGGYSDTMPCAQRKRRRSFPGAARLPPLHRGLMSRPGFAGA